MQSRISLIVVILMAWGMAAAQSHYADLQAELPEMGRMDQDVSLRIGRAADHDAIGSAGIGRLESNQFRI